MKFVVIMIIIKIILSFEGAKLWGLMDYLLSV